MVMMSMWTRWRRWRFNQVLLRIQKKKIINFFFLFFLFNFIYLLLSIQSKQWSSKCVIDQITFRFSHNNSLLKEEKKEWWDLHNKHATQAAYPANSRDDCQWRLPTTRHLLWWWWWLRLLWTTARLAVDRHSPTARVPWALADRRRHDRDRDHVHRRHVRRRPCRRLRLTTQHRRRRRRLRRHLYTTHTA